MTRLKDLVHRADPAELLLEVDRLCDRRDWDGLVSLRDRCLAAVELGKQLWPVAQFAEYRLALEAPGPYAGGVCRAGAGRFALGPLTEVAASTHAWAELADHLPAPWIAATVAQERVIRGEDLRGDARAHADELDLPLVLQPWEDGYPVPVYRSHDMSEGGPPPVEGWETVEASPGPPAELPRVERALTAVTAHWVEHSDGDALVATVRGDAAAAVAALLPSTAAIAPLDTAAAIARIAWAAASGGAHGRRRGMAAGRSTVFSVVHELLRLPYPADPAALAAGLERLRWYAFRDARRRTPAEAGWALRLALEDTEAGWGAAVEAFDRPEA